MKHTRGAAAAVFLLIAFSGCSDMGRTGPGIIDPPRPPPSGTLDAAQKAIVSSANGFGFRLFVALDRNAAGKNLFVSPLSVSMALSMVLNGAEGTTKDGIETTLGYSGLTQDQINRSCLGLETLLTGLDPAVRMQIANSIWYRPTLNVRDAFITANVTYFHAGVNSIDFSSPSAPATINAWASDNTNGRITQVVPSPIPDGVMMYLINAVYFKAAWKYRYETKYTAGDHFTLADGSVQSCQMMSQKDTIPYFSQNGVQGIDLPYGNGEFSMTVILPPPGVNVDAFIAGLTEESWNSWMALMSAKEVGVYFPKFRITWQNSLADVLAAMGMNVAFSDQADFTGIDARGSLRISDVFHSTFVQADEEGTEAAGVTVITVIAAVVGPKSGPILVRLDRPFIYAIREKQTGTVLFMGKLAFPSW